jgi:hypothetical protein
VSVSWQIGQFLGKCINFDNERRFERELAFARLMPVFHLQIFSREANFSFVIGLSTGTKWKTGFRKHLVGFRGRFGDVYA